MGTPVEISSGRALDAFKLDPRIGEFKANPVSYITDRAEKLRSGNFGAEEVEINKKQWQRVRSMAGAILHRLFSFGRP
ncbi:hypothetical protein [Streptomyces purpurogeneiscleroticus]|uniref:hypothetical protein n=1 Tax=Streptomyces purpurogeneiscleroticus TaxID=68259 RepID=UPI001CBB8C5D|nr:hypothetical protein [Streptomyces purpurogeneiscleroticus]